MDELVLELDETQPALTEDTDVSVSLDEDV